MRVAIVLPLLWLLTVATPARGGSPDAIADQPAATLLLPYFQVSVPPATALTTTFAIWNANAAPALAHVTLWTDLAVPVTTFDVYLTGYDVQTIDLGEVIRGNLPQTVDGGLPGCNNAPPSPLPDSSIAHIQASLTGKPSAIFQNRCAGRDLGDGIARGFVTIDAATQCSLQFPGDPGYFVAGGAGTASNDNVLTGDFQIVNRAGKRSYGGNLVAIQAFPADVLATGQYTFYGRFVGWTAADGRQPLASTMGFRYAAGGTGFPADTGFPKNTALLVWRDPKVHQEPFTCGEQPPWYPLNQQEIVIFDEQEDVQVPPPVSPPPPAPLPFPAAAQRVAVDNPDWPIDFAAGWIYLDFNTFVTGASGPSDPNVAQGWAIVVREDFEVGAYGTRGRLRSAMPAIQLRSAFIPPAGP